MKLLTMIHQGTARPGIRLTDTRILDISQGFDLAVARGLIPTTRRLDRPDMLWFIDREVRDGQPYTRLLWTAGLDGLLDDAVVHAGPSVFLNPLHGQRKNAFCVGGNYPGHAAETGRARGEQTTARVWPTFFAKPATAFTGPDHVVHVPSETTQCLDYEVALGVVIGRAGRDIRAEDAMNHVFGYTIVNDLSARDLQVRHGQWFKGKSLDGTCPVGPWIVHKEIIADPHSLEISLRVNGELRQLANTSQMIFKIPEIIAELSAGMTLEPGDLVATGTPAGAGSTMAPPRYLANGDSMRCEIEGIGRMSNFYQCRDN